MSDDLNDLLKGILAGIQVAEGPALPPCPVLGSDEDSCDGKTHTIVARRAVRPCRLRGYREERQRLQAALRQCGYHDDSKPVASTLLKAIDTDRGGVRGLSAAVMEVRKFCAPGPIPAGGHLAMTGDIGTAKTHLLLALYFAFQYRGVSAWWIGSSEIRDVARWMHSFAEEDQDQARIRLDGWRKRQYLFIDDLGDRVSPGAKGPGSTNTAALMLDLLNGSESRLFFTSNLDDEELSKHPDYGPRVVSRLFADHKGHACTVLPISGADQRLHRLRTGS